MRLDLHVHTWRSPDSRSTYDDIVARAVDHGLDGLAITDHNTIAGALDMVGRAPFRIIVGEEIRTPEGEIIGLFLQEEIPRGLPLEETVARVKTQGGLVAVPHPFDRIRRGSALGEAALRRVLDQVDIIEGFNARSLVPGDNERAQAIAEENGLPCSAGSDAHAPYEIGATYVNVADWHTPAEFLQNLRTAQITGQLSSPFVRVSSTWAKLLERL